MTKKIVSPAQDQRIYALISRAMQVPAFQDAIESSGYWWGVRAEVHVMSYLYTPEKRNFMLSFAGRVVRPAGIGRRRLAYAAYLVAASIWGDLAGCDKSGHGLPQSFPELGSAK